MSRVKQLQNELTETWTLVQNLTSENQLLRKIDRRLENALSKYEGPHAQLPLVVRSYDEDIRSLQTRLRSVKGSYRELENRYRAQGAELLAVQKQHKHLLDLTKNKQLGEREKLSNQLEEAENKIKKLENKCQNLIKKMELQNKNHRSQMNAMVNNTKSLQAELNQLKETNDKLERKMEKLKYQSYGGRRSYVWDKILPNPSRDLRNKLTTKCKVVSSVIGLNDGSYGDRKTGKRADTKSLKPQLIHGESDISEHTKDLQKNLMRQVHEDVINTPNMLLDDKSDSSDTTSGLNQGISKLIKEKDYSSTEDGNDSQIKPPTVVRNPFSLSSSKGLVKIGRHRRPLTAPSVDKEVVSSDDGKSVLPETPLMETSKKTYFSDADNDSDCEISSSSSDSSSD